MQIIAFVNRGSGGNKGAKVFTLLSELLGPENVFDIKTDNGPEKGLSLKAGDPNAEVCAMVCGGDGTFSWVADFVEKQQMSHVRIVPLPLGSGNDMSRALGWGIKYPGGSKITKYVEALKKAKRRELDVWRLTVVDNPSFSAQSSTDVDGIEHGARPLMCNYLSFGADAHVEWTFNKRRWDKPHRFKTRGSNLREHFFVGLKYTLTEKKFCVKDHVESLTVDGKEVKIPSALQALICLNIPSYGGGTQPWGFPRKRHNADHMFVDDRRFELIGLKSLSHYARFHLGSHGVRLAQGKHLHIKLKSEETPFQVDGEPWIQHGGHVNLEVGNPVSVCEGLRFKAKSRKTAKFTKTFATPAEP